MKKKVNKKDEIETYMLEGMSIGMCIGTSLGVIIGLFTDNIPIYMFWDKYRFMCWFRNRFFNQKISGSLKL